MVRSITLPPWPSDPFRRTNRLFACYYDPKSRSGILSPAVFFGLPRVGRYCTVDRTPGLFLRWFRLPLPFITWRAAYALRRFGGLRAYAISRRLYGQ